MQETHDKIETEFSFREIITSLSDSLGRVPFEVVNIHVSKNGEGVRFLALVADLCQQ